MGIHVSEQGLNISVNILLILENCLKLGLLETYAIDFCTGFGPLFKNFFV